MKTSSAPYDAPTLLNDAPVEVQELPAVTQVEFGEPVVHVLDDDNDVCRALKNLIQEAGFRAATYNSARDFLAANALNEPGCLILDVRLPGTNGLELQERLAALGSSMPVIVISGYADVALAVRAMRKGAFDFFEKPFDPNLIMQRVRQAVEVDRKAHQRRAEMATIEARIATLTPREREVMKLVVSGYANKRVAATLGISMKTVEAHRAHVMRKMRADSLAELVRLVQMVQAEPPLPPGLGHHSRN